MAGFSCLSKTLKCRDVLSLLDLLGSGFLLFPPSVKVLYICLTVLRSLQAFKLQHMSMCVSAS